MFVRALWVSFAVVVTGATLVVTGALLVTKSY